MPSYEKKESFEQKRKRLASVKVWVENFLDADNKNKNILERFEKNVELELNTEGIGKIDPNAEPINILVLGKFFYHRLAHSWPFGTTCFRWSSYFW
jgi:hypothetical protein